MFSFDALFDRNALSGASRLVGDVSAPLVLSLLGGDENPGPDALRDFLERLVSESATRAQIVIGEAEPGRHILVSPPLEPATMKEQIDETVALALAKLGERFPDPHVTDFGLRELYAQAREPWLARRGFETLVKQGKLGVVTIFCHEWVYDVCRRVADENSLAVQTSLEDYIRDGKFRVAGTNKFQLDVFANLREMAANFDPIEVLVTKVLVLSAVSGDKTLAARLRRIG
jgi:hypothetical protein